MSKNILQELSKKDSIWRQTAFRITNNRDSANELVQEMYMRLLDYNLDVSKINDNFIKVTLYHLFIDSKKGIYNNVEIDECNHIVTKEDNLSYNDKELRYLSKVNKLSYDEKNLLELSYDNSIRDIAKIKDEYYSKTNRDLTWIRIKILGSNYNKEYNNRRLKYKN